MFKTKVLGQERPWSPDPAPDPGAILIPTGAFKVSERNTDYGAAWATNYWAQRPAAGRRGEGKLEARKADEDKERAQKREEVNQPRKSQLGPRLRKSATRAETRADKSGPVGGGAWGSGGGGRSGLGVDDAHWRPWRGHNIRSRAIVTLPSTRFLLRRGGGAEYNIALLGMWRGPDTNGGRDLVRGTHGSSAMRLGAKKPPLGTPPRSPDRIMGRGTPHNVGDAKGGGPAGTLPCALFRPRPGRALYCRDRGRCPCGPRPWHMPRLHRPEVPHELPAFGSLPIS